MAIDAARYGSRDRREAARAAKERREKIVLAACAGILLFLLALEGPKTLAKLRGRSGTAAAPAPSAIAPAPAQGSSTATSAPRAVSLDPVNRYAAKDPFVPQAGQASGATETSIAPNPPPVQASDFVAKDPFVAQVGQSDSAAADGASTVPIPPAVRTSDFVAKDPFVQRRTTGRTPAAPTRAGEVRGSSGRTGYIVLLASVPLSHGRAVAEAAAALARDRGVADVRIVVSSDHSTLRKGFYAIYIGPFSTLAGTLDGLREARSEGYVGAYLRRLAP
jgi:hypothetical protein